MLTLTGFYFLIKERQSSRFFLYTRIIIIYVLKKTKYVWHSDWLKAIYRVTVTVKKQDKDKIKSNQIKSNPANPEVPLVGMEGLFSFPDLQRLQLVMPGLIQRP